MKAFVSIMFCIMVTLVMSPTVQADSFGTNDSYGVWFDRDSVDPYWDAYAGTPSPSGSAVPWGAVDGGTYNTGGIYDVVITYRAIDTDTATMFATINGIQQGFWNTSDPNRYYSEPDYYPTGLSFDSTSLTAMEVFYAFLFPVVRGGTVVVSDITAVGNLGTRDYGDLTFSHTIDATLGQWAGSFNDAFDLTLSDLRLSYTIDFSQITQHEDPSNPANLWVTTYRLQLLELGLKPLSNPDGYQGFDDTTDGAGWMGASAKYLAVTPNRGFINDKFDLQYAWNGDETYYDVQEVPEPSTILLLGFGLAGVGLLRRKFKN